jgi:hypothetical protein
MLGRLKKLWNRFSGAPVACFIAWDLSEKRLREHGADMVQGLSEFFDQLLPCNEEETDLLAAFLAAPQFLLFQAWYDICMKRRNAYLPLPILPIDVEEPESLEQFLRSQKWVRGWKMTRAEVTKTSSRGQST